MAYFDLDRVTLDIPVYDASRSLRREMFARYTGGKITQQENSNIIAVRALEDISFRVDDGDHLGLIGHNGSGKTTLLRLLAGVYEPTSGTVRSGGKITSLFNPAIGMEMDETGYQNIGTVGMYLGMTPAEVAAKADEIADFSELGDFLTLPVRTYSSGMLVRLSFAIATAVRSEILLMDEGIGAGDARFADKAKKRAEEFYSDIRLLIIASHSETFIRDMCDKALLLEHGRTIAFGGVEEVLKIYRERSAAA